ncbi:MAG: hypothetical protein ACI84K_000463 [Pseudohongiellaceae bacterium]|jgi:hypothetical protein
MDYKQSISLLVKGFLLLLLLSGCSEELSTGAKIAPDSLAILGTNDLPIFYDQEIELKYGATGGDGVYRYRYIQNPKDPKDRDEDFVFNPLELEVENNDGAKPFFSLRGIIKSGNGVELEDLVTGTFSYQIEITDGQGSEPHTQTFEYKLEVNKLGFLSSELNIKEGAVSNTAATRLLEQKQAGTKQICDDIGTIAYEEKTLPSGVKVYPMVFDVRLSSPVVDPVEVFYRFTSRYDDQSPERHKSNIGLARPNVDFLEEERSIIFQPGQIACVGYVNLLDDLLIEGIEEFEVEFYHAEGAITNLESGEKLITLQDNEPLPIYATKEIIRNEGGKVVGLFSLVAPYKHPLSIQVSIDGDDTTASPDDFLLQPENGVVTIAPGELEASFTISLLSNNDGLDSGSELDEVISIVTDIDRLVDATPYKITINEWPLTATDEVVSKTANKRTALAVDVAQSGIVSVLLEGMSTFDEEQAVVVARHRDGTKKELVNSETGEIVLAKQGVRVRPVKIGTFVSGENGFYIAVIANVDGLYANVHRGEDDFIVAVFKLDLVEQSTSYGFYTPYSVTQYGSNGDDEVLGAEFNDAGDVYIFGQTNGTEFDGAGSSESNKGGADGFVYKLNLVNKIPVLGWDAPRFIGTADQDRIVALDAGKSDVVVQVETETTDKDVFAVKISSSTGRDIEEIPRGIISSVHDDFGNGVALDGTSSGAYLLVDSQSLLPGGGSTLTLSRDVNVLLYDADGNVRQAKTLSTSDADYSSDIEYFTKNKYIAVGGYTDGEFAGNQRKSPGTSDAFISVFSLDSQNSAPLDVVFQFGTIGNDQVIDIEGVSDNKMLVLWSEESVSQEGEFTYRVSAFSAEGEMLSTEP